mgnify:CR=1 FL=1
MTDLEQLRQHAYEAAEPQEPPCAHCGHEESDHEDIDPDNTDFYDISACTICYCPGYEPRDAQDQSDAEFDAATARWERSEDR